jgi:hypothetical protein
MVKFLLTKERHETTALNERRVDLRFLEGKKAYYDRYGVWEWAGTDFSRLRGRWGRADWIRIVEVGKGVIFGAVF